jgi:predicted ATP-binding protein involved in virulence
MVPKQDSIAKQHEAVQAMQPEDAGRLERSRSFTGKSMVSGKKSILPCEVTLVQWVSNRQRRRILHMIHRLKMTNVGPAPEMELTFGSRLNLLTGDNGLGKSFLLDSAWWALTRVWPGEMNPGLTSGKVALPTDKKRKAEIDFSFSAASKTTNHTSTFEPRIQSWSVPKGRPANPGLVFYAMSDGSFAVWDPARNYWKAKEGKDRPPAYVFSPKEVWDGLQRDDGTWLCNGLIRDWAGWQKEKGRAFENLVSVLDGLSPSATERLEPGTLTRISLDDVRDMPTLKMPYGQEVAVVHASSGMRRIIALAYFLVWCWEEHLKAKELLGEEPVTNTVFLIDEVEAHLHPKWQRVVIPALMNVIKQLTNLHDVVFVDDTDPDNPRKIPVFADVQLIAVTHSPLIMASAEPIFDAQLDAWFDLDFESKTVILRRCEFEKHGDAATWLISEAFDLKSGRSLEYEQLVEQAAALLDNSNPLKEQIANMNQKLVHALNPKDDFLFRWRVICNKKGLME